MQQELSVVDLCLALGLRQSQSLSPRQRKARARARERARQVEKRQRSEGRRMMRQGMRTRSPRRTRSWSSWTAWRRMKKGKEKKSEMNCQGNFAFPALPCSIEIGILAVAGLKFGRPSWVGKSLTCIEVAASILEAWGGSVNRSIFNGNQKSKLEFWRHRMFTVSWKTFSEIILLSSNFKPLNSCWQQLSVDGPVRSSARWAHTSVFLENKRRRSAYFSFFLCAASDIVATDPPMQEAVRAWFLFGLQPSSGRLSIDRYWLAQEVQDT